jgi:hypothetical protein
MQNDIFAEGALDRIFYGELEPNRKQDGSLAHYRVRGFRHESEEARHRGCAVIEASLTKPSAAGVYSASVRVAGVKRKLTHSAFFPATWTRAEVTRAIAEAYQSRRPTRRSQWFRGEARGGFKVELEIGVNGRVADAKPELLLGAKKRKRVCGVCGETLIRKCPREHGAPSQLPHSLRWFKRWLKWKFHNLYDNKANG